MSGTETRTLADLKDLAVASAAVPAEQPKREPKRDAVRPRLRHRPAQERHRARVDQARQGRDH